MTKKEENLIDQFIGRMRKLLVNKGHDYSGEESTLKNFYLLEDLVSPELCCFVRLSDKWIRLKNFLKKGELKVDDEKIEDTLVDLANYSVLLYMILKEKNEEVERNGD